MSMAFIARMNALEARIKALEVEQERAFAREQERQAELTAALQPEPDETFDAPLRSRLFTRCRAAGLRTTPTMTNADLADLLRQSAP